MLLIIVELGDFFLVLESMLVLAEIYRKDPFIGCNNRGEIVP